MIRKIVFLLSLFSIFSLQAMDQEYMGDLEAQRDMCDYVDRNFRTGSSCIGCGFSICLFSVVFKEPFLAEVGAMSCWHGLHHCAIAWNATAEPSTNYCENSMHNAIRCMFCLETPEEEL